VADVLVVEESAKDRTLIGGLLASEAGFCLQFAAGGQQALEQIEQARPDVVLTDLGVADMDGLELVTRIKSQHPLLPVVLMTSKGNEKAALQALHHGATNYVPKRFLREALAMTLRDVLAAACRDGGNARLMSCLTDDRCSFILPNDPELIPSLVSYLQHRVIAIGLVDESQRMRVAVALEEALVNALYHGNLELCSQIREEEPEKYEALVRKRSGVLPYAQRRIFVEARLSRQAIQFTIRDEGPGFNPKSLPDPTAPANLEQVSGRGVFLMRTFMDEVVYNESGNEVTLMKRR
jgi:CheY-like chemotaxis protein